MKNIGLFMFRKDKESEVSLIIQHICDLHMKEKYQKQKLFFKSTERNGYIFSSIDSSYFESETEYDAFFSELGAVLNNLQEIGIVIGAYDKKGFLWTDYKFGDLANRAGRYALEKEIEEKQLKKRVTFS